LISSKYFATKIENFTKDIIKEDTFLKIFECLNESCFEDQKVKKINLELSKMVKWCKNMVSYHILVHPYKIRNENTITEGTEIFEFTSSVDSFMD
jgi:hypothetical protein